MLHLRSALNTQHQGARLSAPLEPGGVGKRLLMVLLTVPFYKDDVLLTNGSVTL